MERTNPHLQVFISFRGKDVRGNILSSLKEKLKDEGVNVKTDEEMPRGRKIDENLQKLIKDSKVAVVIFSENYPESPWCLDELVEIEKQIEETKLKPLPIFFKVRATHVALEDHNPFKDILLRLEDNERENARNGSRVGSGRMHCWSCFLSQRLLKDADKRFVRWRGALKSITGYAGLKYIKDSNQALFVNQIVEAVKEMLGKVQSSDDVHDRIRGLHIVRQQKVFISFGGHDDYTRLGFISHLQAGLKRSGINFYINIENMTKGYDPEELIMNVRESRIALVIFTESYLSSAWCLEELVEINKFTMSLVVIPIFYKVEPKYVRDGRLVEINNQLVLNWGAKDARIDRWKQALNSVGEMSGIVSANLSSEAELVKYIIYETKRTLANISSS
ncbi:hypothetical protein IGI04_041340 [Brassica rapa subsp. trilocularis]|uniref:TIR domain-containing protein n=2 Tax=Brassica TaxID=3705 RepID=A0ABQ8BRZ3_BRANA|nr:uncharacterized protein LOC103846336 [Brassica rapa]XP_013667593.2 uncharacterized protein LOC106372012 [Brassica napus]KAG5376744.1 hypothetical protein IGI04_041340 [Brassica rapa subsp. trilocularis]KAH0907252.1 hypothetical protein HID58_039079 [Brassica napus]